ncbi:MAG: DUF1998 domain-containing protein, partial [Chloroflexi bacterium]|nr:DUF1998 domain-containing protein [Chloroflexota bacterium]
MPDSNSLNQIKTAYDAALSALCGEFDFLRVVWAFDDHPFPAGANAPDRHIIVATAETLREMLTADRSAVWARRFSVIYADDLDAYCRPESSPLVATLRRLIWRAKTSGVLSALVGSVGRFAGNTHFIDTMLGVSGAKGVSDTSLQKRKRLVLWSSILDRESYGRQVVPVPQEEDLRCLLQMLLDMQSDAVLFDPTGMVTQADLNTLCGNVSSPKVSERICLAHTEQELRAFARKEGSDVAMVVPGLAYPVGWYCDRLDAVKEDAHVFLVESRTAFSNLHGHIARAISFKSEPDIPVAALNVGQSGQSLALVPAYPDEAGLRAGILDELESRGPNEREALTTEQATEIFGANTGEILSTCHVPRRERRSLREWIPVTAHEEVLRRGAEPGAQGRSASSLPPTECYPGSIVLLDGHRWEVLAPGPDPSDPWTQVRTQSCADNRVRTHRRYSVEFLHPVRDAVYSMKADRPLVGESRFGSHTVRIRETVHAFDRYIVFAGDRQSEKHTIPPITFAPWLAHVLFVSLPDESRSSGLAAALTRLLPTAIRMRFVVDANAFEIVALTADGVPASNDEGASGLLIYARYPGNFAIARALSNASALKDVLSYSLWILLACPCAVGCENCLGAGFSSEDKPIHKDSVIRALGALLTHVEASRIADDRKGMSQLERLQSRVLDRIAPGLFATQLGLRMDAPVPLRWMEGEVAKEHSGCQGVYTGKAVYVQKGLLETEYIGLLAHEYGHQLQHRGDLTIAPDLQRANGDNIEDEANVLFPVCKPDWDHCHAVLYVEGTAQWIQFRVLDVFNLKQDMIRTQARKHDEYGEGFQHVLWLERRYGIRGMLDMIAGKATLYRDDHADKQTLYNRSGLYAALEDSASHLRLAGGLRCCDAHQDWPFYVRVSHFRALARRAGGNLPNLTVSERDAAT